MQHLSSIVISMSLSASVTAQLPTVSCGLYPSKVDPSVIQLKVKPDANFNGLYSGSAFTIRWPEATALQIGTVTQSPSAAAYHPMSTQGSISVDQHFRYQKFAGFGMTTMADAGTTWMKDSQYVLAEIHITGHPRVGYFELIKDSWTAGTNSDCYQELNGEDVTGTYYHPMVILNVDLDNFSALPEDNRNALVKWSTLGEYNTSHFDVLRSTDLSNWTLAETLPASTFTAESTSYGIVDSDVHPNDESELTVFYKLRAVDLSGNVTEYEPEAVSFTRDPLWDPYSVYPNPATEFVTVAVPAEWGALRYDVSTAIDQRVITGQLPEGGGRIDLTHLPVAAIIVHVYDANGTSVISQPILHTSRR